MKSLNRVMILNETINEEFHILFYKLKILIKSLVSKICSVEFLNLIRKLLCKVFWAN